MTIENLVEQYEWTKRKNREYDFSQHITRKYMPYAEKCALVKGVVDSSSYIEFDGKKIYRRNTANMLFVFTMQIISKYTDLEFDTDATVKCYDKLMESGMMNKLMSQIPEEEISILRGMLDMQRDDEEANTRSIVSFLETKVEALQMGFDSLNKILERPDTQEKIANM